MENMLSNYNHQNNFYKLLNDAVERFGLKNVWARLFTELLILHYSNKFASMLTSQINSSTTEFQQELVVKFLFMFRKFYRRITFDTRMTLTISQFDAKKTTNDMYDMFYWYFSTYKANIDESKIHVSVINQRNQSSIMPDVLLSPETLQIRTITYNGVELEIKHYVNDFLVNNNTGTTAKSNNYIELYYDKQPNNEEFVINFFTMVTEKYNLRNNKKSNGGDRYRYVNNQFQKINTGIIKDINTIVLPKKQLDVLMDEVTKFSTEPAWYKKRGFNHTLHVLLHGVPGCGKSSTISALSKILNRPLYYLNVNNITSEDTFIKLTSSIPMKEIILVLEEVDLMNAVRKVSAKIVEEKKDKQPIINIQMPSQGRMGKGGMMEEAFDSTPSKPADGKGELNQATIRSFLQGELTTEGQVVIFTTNHKEDLDEAIIREGRFALDLELGKCTRDMITRLFTLIYDKEDITKEELDLINRIPENTVTPATVSNTFRLYYKNSIDGLNEIILNINKYKDQDKQKESLIQ